MNLPRAPQSRVMKKHLTTTCRGCHNITLSCERSSCSDARSTMLTLMCTSLLLSNALARYVLPNFLVRPAELADNVLVIHFRSGDVMRNTRGVKYWQPPLKYYKYIIDTFHPTDDIVLATEEHGAADGVVGGNPVVEQLLRWRPSIRFPPADFRGDVSTLLGARSLVQAISSFSATLAIMSPRLRRTCVTCRWFSCSSVVSSRVLSLATACVPEIARASCRESFFVVLQISCLQTVRMCANAHCPFFLVFFFL